MLYPGVEESASLVKELADTCRFELVFNMLEVRAPRWEGIGASLVVVLKALGY